MPNVNQETLGGFRAPVGQRGLVPLLTVCVGVIGANSLVLSPIAAEVAAAFAAPVPAVMTAAAAYGLGTAAAALLLARQIDRFGSRRLLTLALAVLALALAASAAAPTVWILIAAQLLAGLAAGVALPAVYALAAESAAPGRESATLGAVLTGWTLSLVAGVSLSTLIADLVHWRAVYGALTGGALLAAACLALGPAAAPPAGGGPAALPWQALRLPGVARLLLVCAGYMIAFYGVYGYLGAHLQESLGVPTSANGAVTLAYGLGFGGAALLDRMIDRLGPARLMLPAYAAIAAVYLALGLGSGSLAALVALALVWGLMNHFGLNLLILRLSAIDPARRGAVLGLNSAVTYLCVFIGTLGFGPLYSLAGFAPLTWLAAALCLFAAVLTRSRRRFREG